MGHGMAHHDGIQIVPHILKTAPLQFFPVAAVVHHVVERVDTGIAGESGDDAQDHYGRRRKDAQPGQRRKGGGGHVQKAVGGAGKRPEKLEACPAAINRYVFDSHGFSVVEGLAGT